MNVFCIAGADQSKCDGPCGVPFESSCHLSHHSYDFFREYSPRNSVVQVAPWSDDFSHICSTLSGPMRTIRTRLTIIWPSVPWLGPENSAEPDATLPLTKTCTRPWLSANIPCQLLSSAL